MKAGECVIIDNQRATIKTATQGLRKSWSMKRHFVVEIVMRLARSTCLYSFFDRKLCILNRFNKAPHPSICHLHFLLQVNEECYTACFRNSGVFLSLVTHAELVGANQTLIRKKLWGPHCIRYLWGRSLLSMRLVCSNILK